MNGLIGNTPMIKINYEIEGKLKSVYTKLEYYNLTGSIKDRMAYYIIDEAKKNGVLKDNQPIIEATSGNTGISFSALGAYFNHEVHIFMPGWVSIERKKLMEMYGTHVYLVSKEEGGFLKCIEKADELALKINGFRPNQFENLDNVLAHYNTTGQEIIDKLSNVKYFVSGIGTGGTLIGIGKKLKELGVKIYALEPESLPVITKGVKEGEHKIEGIGDEFVPEIVDLSIIEEILLINDLDSINMARMLAKDLGLGVGISSGANLLAAIILNEKFNEKTVTVFPDDNKKYLTTLLSEKIDNNPNFLSNKIKLINYEIV